jgi:hypothetical protein
LASTNSVVIYGHIVQWNLEDSSAVSEATSTLAWYSTAAPAVKSGAQPDSTLTWWNVKTISFHAGSTQTTGSPAYCRLLEKDSSGPILFHADIDENAPFTVISQTYDPPLRCRPVWFTSKSVGFATGAKWIFHLA